MKNGEFVIDNEKGTILFFQKYHDKMMFGESKCHKNDKFNVIVGQLIAMKRCELKIRKQEIKAVRNAIEDFKFWREHTCEIGQERLIEHYVQYSNEVLKNHLNHVKELKSDIKKLEENTYTLPKNAENLKYEYINGSMKLVALNA